ncbi:hypothetical protein C8J57DRAFT_1256019 [Mycena rebaudengoi]|nr:hypothetical protein C8J57DRAFT_1256019 [Mycena rebaudengoi]
MYNTLPARKELSRLRVIGPPNDWNISIVRGAISDQDVLDDDQEYWLVWTILIPQHRRPLDVAINDANKPRIFDPKIDRITEGLVLVSTPTFLSAPNLKYGLQVPPKPFLAQASELSILGSKRASFIGLSTSVINSLTKSFPTVFKRRDCLDVPRRQIRRHPRFPPDFSPPCSRSIAPMHPDLGPDTRHLFRASAVVQKLGRVSAQLLAHCVIHPAWSDNRCRSLRRSSLPRGISAPCARAPSRPSWGHVFRIQRTKNSVVQGLWQAETRHAGAPRLIRAAGEAARDGTRTHPPAW